MMISSTCLVEPGMSSTRFVVSGPRSNVFTS